MTENIIPILPGQDAKPSQFTPQVSPVFIFTPKEPSEKIMIFNFVDLWPTVNFQASFTKYFVYRQTNQQKKQTRVTNITSLVEVKIIKKSLCVFT